MVQFAGDEAKKAMQEFAAGKLSADKMRAVIDATQERAEGLHYDSRRKVLEYDNVLMQQRQVIYDQRDKVLAMDDIHTLLDALLDQNLKDALEGGERIAAEDLLCRVALEGIYNYRYHV